MVMPAETKVFWGPCAAVVRVRCAEDGVGIGLSFENRWIVSDGTPNVVLVESPLADIFQPNGDGVVHFQVTHGRVLITTGCYPWRIKERPGDSSQPAKVARIVGATAARRAARDSICREGWIIDAAGERALSLRLTEKCPEIHDKHHV
jgi:hypothetical protein